MQLSLHNIAPDFHNSFPGFNLNCPLLVLDDATLWNQPGGQWQIALAVTAESALAYEPKDIQRMKRLLRDFPEQKVAPRLKGGGPKLQATLAVLQRLASATPSPKEFLSQLSLQIVIAVQRGRLSQDVALAVLYGKPNKKKQQLDKWQTTVIFDVADLDRFPYRVADPAVAHEWSAMLLQFDAKSAASPKPGAFICALTGKSDLPVGDKMPNPNLKVLGPTYLMSMNADARCQTRYGQTSTSIFPAGKETVHGLNDAILFITDPSRQYKTWAAVPSGFKDEQNLLITYLEEEPTSDIPLARLFADVQLDEAQELATYEARTAQIHAALRLLEKPGRDKYIRVLALGKLDRGRKGVVFSGRYSVPAVYQGRDSWLAGARNVPSITIPFPVGKGKPAEWRDRYLPSPSEVMVSFKKQWLRAGQESQSVPGVDIGSLYGLLLDADATNQAKWLLGRYVPLTAPLCAGIGRSLRGGASLSESARKEALIVIGVYGILLFRQGRSKEIYMESRDYLLGQFLQLADLLHKLYCIRERNNAIPPQLIGNAALSMAMQSPRRALTVLSNRMAVYLAWAERFQGEEAGLAKWTRKELGRVSGLLKEQDLDLRVSSNGKAEVLLGYLANTKHSDN